MVMPLCVAQKIIAPCPRSCQRGFSSLINALRPAFCVERGIVRINAQSKHWFCIAEKVCIAKRRDYDRITFFDERCMIECRISLQIQ